MLAKAPSGHCHLTPIQPDYCTTQLLYSCYISRHSSGQQQEKLHLCVLTAVVKKLQHFTFLVYRQLRHSASDLLSLCPNLTAEISCQQLWPLFQAAMTAFTSHSFDWPLLRGGIKNCFFLLSVKKGGGVSANPKNPYQKIFRSFDNFYHFWPKTECFFLPFLTKNWVFFYHFFN